MSREGFKIFLFSCLGGTLIGLFCAYMFYLFVTYGLS